MALTQTQVSQLYVSIFGRASEGDGNTYWQTDQDSMAATADAMLATDAAATYFGTSLDDDQAFIEHIYLNTLGKTYADDPDGVDYWVAELTGGTSRGQVVANMINAAMDPQYAGLAAQDQFINKVAVSDYTAGIITTADVSDLSAFMQFISGVTDDDATVTDAEAAVDAWASPAPFNLTVESAAGADVMRLTGDMGARIDLTGNDNQVTGLDLDGDGTIELNGLENNNPTTLDDGIDFEIIDAYSRNSLNQGDIRNNFLGDIAFDGTGFSGDGVSTDGNIFLGGLGVDTAYGGIGNDFLAGGGVAADRFVLEYDSATGTFVARDTLTDELQPFLGAFDTQDNLYGGRNADFFFASLSELDPTDGDNLSIDGGSTSDDSAAGNNTSQDSDWLLLEASDDDEPVTISLALEGAQTLRAETSGITVTMQEIENVDASGNLYGFLNDISTTIGEGGGEAHTQGTENFAYGASAQLNITGSIADNILIGGFDNDLINGGVGDDILMGGNLNYNNNPNTADIVNDGTDTLFGGGGDDDIVFEADGGIIEGDNAQNADDGFTSDTLWLTDLSLGTQAVADMTTDSTLRFDLLAENLNNAAGYGGADFGTTDLALNDTQDQTNYTDGDDRVSVQDMENVIATGLGAVDYLAAGTNDPELNFNNQQNIAGYEGDLTLRGLNNDNILYANTGNDILEGRRGDDSLSGGLGNDDFIFQLAGAGDGLDIIHRQADADADNLWDIELDDDGNPVDADNDGVNDLAYTQDFGDSGQAVTSNSSLTITLNDTANPANELLDIPVSGIVFTLDGTEYTVQSDDIGATATYADFLTGLNTALDADPALEGLNAVLNADNTITITDPAGGIFTAVGYTWVGNVAPASGDISWDMAVGGPEIEQAIDRLIFASYEDRADGELRDDNGFVNETGDAVTLGADAYAEDLVVRFDSDGNGTTVLAEDQQWDLEFLNLADEDTVEISVNGTAFSLQMGVAADGTAIAETQAGFLQRMVDLINAGSDNDTLAGTLVAALTNGVSAAVNDTISLTQGNYYTGQVAFMDEPVVTIGNASGGEAASVTIDQPNTDSEVTLFEYDGLGGNLNAENVLFLGGSGMNDGVVTNADNSRSILETAAVDGGALEGSDALILDSMLDADTLATDFSLHGDDLLFTGAGDDVVTAGTGDDRIFGSVGTDTVDGGKDLYVVQTLVAGEIVESVGTPLNAYDAAQRLTAADVVAVALLEEDNTFGAADGFVDQLIFSTNDFAGTDEFTITVDDDLDQEFGGAGTVGVDEGDDGVINHLTTFTEMEAIRTLAGDGTHAGQGNDTLDVTALSNAVAASDVGDPDAAVVYNMTSELGFIQINADLNDDDEINDDPNQNPFDPDTADENDTFLAVDGVERLIGGNANEQLNIDESEVNKDNYFDGAGEVTQVDDGDPLTTDDPDLDGDSIVYDHSDMDNAGGADFPFDAAALAMRPSANVTIESALETDTVAFTGGTIVGSDTTTDTLIDVETIDLNDAARSLTLDDTLTLTNIAGVTADFQNEQVLSGATVLAYIDDMTELENTVMGTGNDTVLVADTMTNIRNAPALIDNNSFLFFGAETLNSIEVSNQSLYTFDFGTGAADVLDYRAENDQDIAVVLDYSGTGEDRVVVATNIDAADLNQLTDRVDLVTGADIFYSGDGTMDSIIDLSQHVNDVDVVFSPNVVADEDARAIDIRVAGVSISKQFMDDALTAAERADLVPDAGQEAYWNRIEGNDLNETMTLTDYVSGHNMVFNLQGGQNVLDYNATTVGTTLNLLNVAGNATQQTVRIDTEDTFGGTGIHIGTGDVGTIRIQGSSTGDDYINLQNVDDDVSYTIDLNIPDGPGLKGEIAMAAVDMPLANGNTTDPWDFQAVTTTVAGYENIAGNDADNTYSLNPYVNDVYMGTGDDILLVDGNIGDLAGDTIVGDMQGSLANTQARVIAGTLLPGPMAAGSDTIRLTGNMTDGLYVFNMNNGTNDQFIAGAGSSAAIYGFENVDASGATDSNDTFNLTGSTRSASVLRGGAGNDILTAVTNAAGNVSTLDGGAGADIVDFGIVGAGVEGVWEAGDSNSASQDNVIDFTSLTDFATIKVDMATAGVVDVSASFATGATADRVLTNGVVSAYYDTTNNDLLVDIDADGVNDATGDLTITSANAFAAADVKFDITGTAAANTITGGGADDTITGGAGDDVMDGGQIDAVGETLTFQFNAGSFTTGTNDGEAEIAGLEFNEDGDVYVADGADTTTGALVQAGVAGLTDGMDADALGSAIAAMSIADWEAGGVIGAGDLASVTYDDSSNLVSFNFNYLAGDQGPAALTSELFAGLIDPPNDIQIQGVAEGAGPANSTDTASYADQVDSNDTFNIAFGGEGSDTINNFGVGGPGDDDVIDFTGDNDTIVNDVWNTNVYAEYNLGGPGPGSLVGAFNVNSDLTDLAALTAAEVANDLSARLLQNAGDIVYVAYDDGTDTGIFRIDDAAGNNDSVIDEAEVTLLVTLLGVGDASGLDAANFADFA